MKRSVPFLLAFVSAAICIRLGFWQIDRLRQRRAFNASVAERLLLPPVDLSGTLPDSLRFRRAVAQGTFDFDHQVVEVARSLDGLPGVYVVTPLRLGNGRTVLVERGWAYAADARRVNLAAFLEPPDAVVEGVVVTHEPLTAIGVTGRPPGNPWPQFVRSAEPQKLQVDYPYPVLSLVLRRTPANDTTAGLRTIPPPALDDGPHLSYAIQWFSFALIGLVGTVVLVKTKRTAATDEHG